MAPAAALSDSFFLLSGWFWLDVKRRLHGSQAAFVWEAATAQVFPVAKKRSYAKVRVQLRGVRLSCSVEKHFELKAMLVQRRKKQSRWTYRAWRLSGKETA